MKKIIWIFIVTSFIYTGLVKAAPVVYFDFNGDAVMDVSTTVQAGGNVTASLYVSGVDGIHGGLLSWGTQIDFTSSLMSGSGYTINPVWPLPGVNNNINNGSGVIELLASAFSGQTGTIKLADIVFDAPLVGIATLSSGELFPANGSFVGFAGADGHDYDPEVNFQSASISITAVPLPAAIYMLISGIMLLGSFAQRSKSVVQAR